MGKKDPDTFTTTLTITAGNWDKRVRNKVLTAIAAGKALMWALLPENCNVRQQTDPAAPPIEDGDTRPSIDPEQLEVLKTLAREGFQLSLTPFHNFDLPTLREINKHFGHQSDINRFIETLALALKLKG